MRDSHDLSSKTGHTGVVYKGHTGVNSLNNVIGI